MVRREMDSQSTACFFSPARRVLFRVAEVADEGVSRQSLTKFIMIAKWLAGARGAVAVVKETRVKHTAAAQRVC